jgi:putative transposase
VVRGSVEETLNALLDAEADRLCNAQRYERSEARRDTRAGHYERNLQTRAGEVRLKVPKLRQQTFETAIIERYRRRKRTRHEIGDLCDHFVPQTGIECGVVDVTNQF